MSFLPTPIICDVCKASKTAVNHWFYANILGGFNVYKWDPDAENPKNVDVIHLCGHVCVVKKLSEWLDSCATPTSRDTVA